MTPLLLFFAAQSAAITDEQFDRYVSGCKSDYEQGLADLDEGFRNHKLKPWRESFWTKLPASERPFAKRICLAWLLGQRYQMGKTSIVIAPKQ
jgi:hypothetical protein